MLCRIFQERAVEGVNIHRTERGYQVHVRRYGSAFRVAQAHHASVEAALAEHLPSHGLKPVTATLMDLL